MRSEQSVLLAIFATSKLCNQLFLLPVNLWVEFLVLKYFVLEQELGLLVKSNKRWKTLAYLIHNMTDSLAIFTKLLFSKWTELLN